MTDIPRVDLAKDVFSTDVSSRLLSDMYRWNNVDYALEEYRKTYATLHSFVIGEFLGDEMKFLMEDIVNKAIVTIPKTP